MWTILKKEVRSFLSALIAYMVMLVFLIAVGLFLWILKGYTVFDLGVAGLDVLFQFAPLLFIFLVSAITMRSFAEEKRLGTLETLTTHPVSDWGIILGKFFAALALVVFALLPTLVYVYTIWTLGDPRGNLDTGATLGSYTGLLLLGAAFVSMGLFASVWADNQIVALIGGMALCFLWYQLLGMIGELPNLPFLSNMLEWLTLDFHYRSISRGVLDTRDMVYFASFTGLFLYFTKLKFSSRKW